MTKTTLLKSITLLFSFGMMAIFVAYRMGAFEEKKSHIESNAPGYVYESSGMVKKFSDFTEPKERPMRDLELLPTSKSTVIVTDHPLLQYPADSKIRKNAQSTELSAEELFILSSSKSTLIIEPEKLSFPLTNPDSIKKPN